MDDCARCMSCLWCEALTLIPAWCCCDCRRTHLSQRVNVPPSGGLFQLCALREQDIAQWDQRVASLAAIFPNVKEVCTSVYVVCL